MENYDLLIHEGASEIFKRSRGESRRQIAQFIDTLGSNPFLRSEHSYEDRKGRVVQKFHVRGYVIDYAVDHALKEVKILEITKIG